MGGERGGAGLGRRKGTESPPRQKKSTVVSCSDAPILTVAEGLRAQHPCGVQGLYLPRVLSNRQSPGGKAKPPGGCYCPNELWVQDSGGRWAKSKGAARASVWTELVAASSRRKVQGGQLGRHPEQKPQLQQHERWWRCFLFLLLLTRNTTETLTALKAGGDGGGKGEGRHQDTGLGRETSLIKGGGGNKK